MPSEDILAVDEALSRLAAEEPVKAELVKLRYFGGLSVEDAGRVLGISRATADRYWAACPGLVVQRAERDRSEKNHYPVRQHARLDFALSSRGRRFFLSS